MTEKTKTQSLVQEYKEMTQRIDQLVTERMELRDTLRKATQVNNSTLSHWLRGRKTPQEPNRIKIAKALNRTVEELFPYV